MIICERDDFFWFSLFLGGKMDICGRDDLFFLAFTCLWAESWTSVDVITLKEPVFLLRSENMETLHFNNHPFQSYVKRAQRMLLRIISPTSESFL